MSYNPLKHNRQSIRLPGWDYTACAAYFVTLCTCRRQCIFGEVVAGRMFLNEWGRIVQKEWIRSEEIHHEVSLGAYIVMPNHLHAIVLMNRATSRLTATRLGFHSDRQHVGRSTSIRIEWPQRRKSQSLGSLIAGFKASVTRRINQTRRLPGDKVWQRNYWERILRSRQEYKAAERYIRDNPAVWYRDRNHPDYL